MGLTGTAAFRSRVRRAFAALGAGTVDVQRSHIQPCCTPGALATGLESLPGWVAFTSPNGVEIFFRLLCRAGVDLRRLSPVRFAAVGPPHSGAAGAAGNPPRPGARPP